MRNRILPYLLVLVAFWGSSPVQAQTLWGATSAGVADNKGVIFKTNANGSGYSVRHNFVTDFPGSAPYSSLTLSGGKLYGTSSAGGANDQGVIFEFDPATGTYTKKVDFSAATTGSFPYGGMVKAANGQLYGVTSSGGNNSVGVLFEYTPGTTSLTIRHHFTASTGSNPNGNLIQAANGKFYGLAPLGGANGSGVLFEYDISLGYSDKFDFDGTNGSQPYGDLVEYSNGKLYGLTSGGGSGGAGVLFEFDPATGITTKKKDISAVGLNPYGSLTNANSSLWGMTLFGGVNSEGVIFQYDPVGNTLTKKKDLSASTTGSYPLGSFYLATNSLLYAMTSGGGAAGDGTIIEYDPGAGNTLSKKFDFASLVSGRNPQYNNLVEVSGKLYGLTAFGGPVDHGVLFEFDHSTSTFSKKVDFSNSTEGSNPQGSLIRATNGLLYGLTSKGGAFGQGVLFSIDPGNDTYTPIENFSLTAFGAYPSGALVEAANAKLYGMAPYGGSHDNGVIFEYNPVGDYFFNRVDLQASTTGSKPQGSLVSATNGKLYGTTSQGGANGVGTLFEFDPNTLTVTNTVSFNGAGNGSTPTGTLLQAANGKLYGMTSLGGVGGNGVVFEYNTTTGVLSKKADFAGSNGANPFGELMQATNGKLYGVTSGGGSNSYGVIFEFDQVTNVITNKYNFDQTNSGAGPAGGLTEVAQGDLFGMNPSGGAQGVGVYFKFTLAGAFSKLLDFGGANGSSPQFASVLIVPPKLNQTITFNALPAKMITDAPFSLSGTSSSGLPITYVSSNPSIASISGNTVTINNGGTVTISASQYGNTTYQYAQDVVQTLVINKSSQTITFTLPPKTYGDVPFALNGTSSSGLAVTYVSADPTIASITGSTLTILKAGSVIITASQAGNAIYDPAPDVPVTLVISKADQTITFSQPGLPLGQVPFTNLTENLVASATSGLTVSYSSTPAGIVSISGNVATFLSAGTVTITAMQAGDGNYNAAPGVPKALTITLGSQTITFNGPLPSKVYGDTPFDLTATASSGLPISYSSTDPTVISITGSTVTILKPGSVVITASQPGNSSYDAAPPKTQPLLINQASQTITFNPLPARAVTDGSFTLTATASSGLPITYNSDNTSVITISGSTATIQGLGNANITASQPGNVNYLAATSVSQLQVINNKLSQTITFNTLPNKTFGDVPFNLTASSTSGLPVTFASSNPAVATISGTTVTIVGGGTTIITASQAGDATYNPAPDVARTQLVQSAAQTITFGPIAPVTIGDPPFVLTATASSGLPITYVNVTSSKISISGNTVTILAMGRATIRARQDGNSNFGAAAPVDRTFCINPVKPTITVTNLTSSSATLTSSGPIGNQWYKNGIVLSSGTGQVLNATSGGIYTVNVTIDACVSLFSDGENLLITGDIATQQPTPIIYPNPAAEKLYVDLTNFEPSMVTIKTFDIAGRQLLREDHSGGQMVEMNVDGYAPGVYLLVIDQGEASSRVRWIKQ